MSISKLSAEDVEANKDLTDLKPELDFVQKKFGYLHCKYCKLTETSETDRY